ncbi:MAG: HAMP domain-containing histidine kinase [Oscillospiraceae bacterium]|jgi:signal transduction histidine kinase|nr:HAMP domain-containing histidine kinase [Oscillospiraceae bacterium]
MNVMQGITKRWAKNTLLIIAAVTAAAVIFLSILVHFFYTNNVSNVLEKSISWLTDVFVDYKATDTESFYLQAREFIENFPDKDKIEVQILNGEGTVVANSTGFPNNSKEVPPDFTQAKNSTSGYSMQNLTQTSGEDVKALTKIIHGTDGTVFGGIRFVTSMERTNARVTLFVGLFVFVWLVIFCLVYFSGAYFIRSIVKPVKEISDVANKMAVGDFSSDITKMYDDEIGSLCDSINNMAQDLKNNEQLKNDFISRVSHEIKTPLTAIRGWAETMQAVGANDTETFDKGMQIIVHESARLTEMVDELLDFSRLQNSKLVLNAAEFNVVPELDDTVYMMKERAFTEGKVIYYEPSTSIDSTIYGDKNRLRQVFLNIIDNALKYSQKGDSIAIDIKETHSNIVISISDTGCGIAPEDLPRVKEKFYKANKLINGAGIGLAVADEIVALHKGEIAIESSIGVGTTVTITLPIFNKIVAQTAPIAPLIPPSIIPGVVPPFAATMAPPITTPPEEQPFEQDDFGMDMELE